MAEPQHDYLVRGSDGRDYPADRATIWKWIREGQVRPGQQVYDSLRGRWAPAQEHPDLRDAFGVTERQYAAPVYSASNTIPANYAGRTLVGVVVIIALTVMAASYYLFGLVVAASFIVAGWVAVTKDSSPIGGVVGPEISSTAQASLLLLAGFVIGGLAIGDALEQYNKSKATSLELAQKAEVEVAQVEKDRRSRDESLATARASLERLDAGKQPEEYARQCETLEKFDKPSMSADVLAKCGVAHFSVAKRHLANGNLTEARRVYDIARVAAAADGPEFVRFTEQLTKREAAAREKRNAEYLARSKREAREQEKKAAVVREAYGDVLRERFLDQSRDIKVTVSGAKKDRITLKFILFNDVWAHRIQKDGLGTELCALGFKRITMTDGYDYTVYLDCN